MADTKVSELTAATSVAADDILMLVQSGTSKKVTTANFFADVATPVKFSDSISIGDTNTMSAPGEIILSTNITLLTNPSASGLLNLGSGSEGQVKIVIMTANVGGNTLTLQDSQIDVDVTFASAGDTATLLYHNTKWYMIGGTASTS